MITMFVVFGILLKRCLLHPCFHVAGSYSRNLSRFAHGSPRCGGRELQPAYHRIMVIRRYTVTCRAGALADSYTFACTDSQAYILVCWLSHNKVAQS